MNYIHNRYNRLCKNRKLYFVFMCRYCRRGCGNWATRFFFSINIVGDSSSLVGKVGLLSLYSFRTVHNNNVVFGADLHHYTIITIRYYYLVLRGGKRPPPPQLYDDFGCTYYCHYHRRRTRRIDDYTLRTVCAVAAAAVTRGQQPRARNVTAREKKMWASRKPSEGRERWRYRRGRRRGKFEYKRTSENRVRFDDESL